MIDKALEEEGIPIPHTNKGQVIEDASEFNSEDDEYGEELDDDLKNHKKGQYQ